MWPLLAHEVLPRDSGDDGVGLMWLILAIHAFDAGKDSPASSQAMVEAVFSEWSKRWARVLSGAQSWSHSAAMQGYEWIRADLAMQDAMRGSVHATGLSAEAERKRIAKEVDDAR